jgi:hypothetical protein
MDQRTRAGVSAYIRRNAIGCVALFLTLTGGTAMALNGQNTVFSDDIVNGEVTTADLAERAVTTNRLASDAVNNGKVLDDSLRTEDIRDGTILAVDVAFGTLRGDEILDGTIGGNDIVDDGVTGDDVNEGSLFNDNSLTTADLADGSVGKGELGANSVGASELGDALVNREDPTPTLIDGGVAHNGAYNTSQSTAECGPGEEVIGGFGYWPAGGGLDAELFIVGTRVDHADESVIVGGGNDSGDDATLAAVAICLTL